MSPSPANFGIALALINSAVAVFLIATCERTELQVEILETAAMGQPRRVVIPRQLAARVEFGVDGNMTNENTVLAPGIRRFVWTTRYRGTQSRSVFQTRLIGPYQDPKRPPCSVRLLVGQSLLDDGTLSPNTLAGLAKRTIERRLHGLSKWPAGQFRKVETVRLNWRSMAQPAQPGASDKLLQRLRRFMRRRQRKQPFTDEPGYIHIRVELRFSRAKLRLTAFLAATAEQGGLAMHPFVAGEISFDSRVYQWMSDMLNGDEIAAGTAQQVIRLGLAQLFEKPPPIPIPGGGHIRLRYCRNPAATVSVPHPSYGAIPMAVVLEQAASSEAAPSIEPTASDIAPVLIPDSLPTRATAASAEALSAPLGIEIDLNGINGILYRLWAGGFFARWLARGTLAKRFNKSPLTRRFLSVQINELALNLPPTIQPRSGRSAAGSPFVLRSQLGLRLHDRGYSIPASVFSQVGIALSTDQSKPSKQFAMKLHLDELALTCEPKPGRLVPCYGGLLTWFSRRADKLHGPLSQVVSKQLEQVLQSRSLGSRVARLQLDRVELKLREGGRAGGHLRGELHGAIQWNVER